MIKHSIVINRPAEEVFAYLDQVDRHNEWQGQLVSTAVETDGPIRVGTRVVERRIVPGRISVGLLTASLAFLAVAESVSQDHLHQGPLELLVNTLPLAAIYMIVLFGRRIRMQEAQAEQLLIELEETRGAELRAAALAERQRLARDMHDVLAHSLSGLLLQLEGARLLAVSNPGDERLAGTIDRAHELARGGLEEAQRFNDPSSGGCRQGAELAQRSRSLIASPRLNSFP